MMFQILIYPTSRILDGELRSKPKFPAFWKKGHPGIPPKEINVAIHEAGKIALLTGTVFGLGGLAFYRYFHRVPLRHPPGDAGAILAPADGRVWQVLPLSGQPSLRIDKRFLGKIETLTHDVEDAAHLVSIFMSPLDCHVNWSPLEGDVVYVRHTPGSFSLANTWKSLWNEKNEILFKGSDFTLKMIQIAGFVARRIDCWLEPGQKVNRGERIGMIRLGSQVSLVLPSRAQVQVKPGQKVRGSETVLATVRGHG